MEAKDFLTILGLGLAIWGLLPNTKRRFILLFFSNTEICLFFISITLLHFLFAFDWLKDHWNIMSWLQVFTCEKGLPPSTYAYFLALGIITYPIMKVQWGYFSRDRIPKAIRLYETLLKEGEIDDLVRHIEKYHIDDIQKYLIGKSHLPEKSIEEFYLVSRTGDFNKAYDVLIKPVRIDYASHVFYAVLENEEFIEKASNKYSELFAQAYSGMETKQASSEHNVKLYLECLFESRNQKLIGELKQMSETQESIKSRKHELRNGLPILSGVLLNTMAAFANNVWYPIGEGVIKSLKCDKSQHEFLKKKHDFQLESELWNQKAYVGIVFFDCMVRETIYHNSGYHMWLYYYRHFTDEIIGQIPEENEYEKESEYQSMYHVLLEKMFSAMRGWLELAKEQNVEYRIIDTINCLGYCMEALAITDNKKISEYFKKQIFNSIIEIWFRFSEIEQNKATDLVLSQLIEMFKQPKMKLYGDDKSSVDYINLMLVSWEGFDKIPYHDMDDNRLIKDFQDQVVTPLGKLQNQ